MNINDFVNQRRITAYNQKEHLASLHQFLFFLKEVHFSPEELKTGVSVKNNVNYSNISSSMIFLPSVNDSATIDSYTFKNTIAPKLQTHVGIEAIRAARDSFSAIYPFNKLQKNNTPQELNNIETNVKNITRPFFEIMSFVSDLELPNVHSFVANGYFGSNLVASYHENLILLAMHNYATFNLDEFKNLIEKIVPDNSLNNPKFLKLLSSILYNDEKLSLMNTVFKKIDKRRFALSCLSQTQNHRNFFLGFQMFLKNPLEHLSFFTSEDGNDKEHFIEEIFSNLSKIGMLNNGYYLKNFSAEDKKKLSSFVQSLTENNNLLARLTTSPRFHNIDFDALVSKPIIFNSRLISSVLLNSNNNKKSNISSLLNFLDNDKISFTELGHCLANSNNINSALNHINKYFTQKNILEIMNSDPRLFKALEATYRGMRLHETLDSKNEEKINRARSKI